MEKGKEPKEIQGDALDKNLLVKIVNNLREIIGISDLEGRFTFISPSVKEQLGYEMAEGLGRTFKEFIHPNDIKKYVDYFNRDIKDEMDTTTLNFRVRHKNGSYRWYNVRGRILYNEKGRPQEYLGIGIDVTDQIEYEKKLKSAYEEIEIAYQHLQAAEEEIKAQYEELHSAYEQLQAAEEEIRAQYETLEKNQQELLEIHKKIEDIINSLPDATFVIDKDDNVILWNYGMEELTGVAAKDALNKKSYEFTDKFYHGKRYSLAHWCLQGKLPPPEDYLEVRKEGRILKAQIGPVDIAGKEKYFSLSIALLYNTKGGIEGAIETIRDITHGKLMEESLRLSEEKFRKLAENTPAMVFVGQGEKYKYVNPAFCEVTGYSADELYNMLIWDVVHPEHREMVRKRGLDRQAGKKMPDRYEFKLLTKEGEVKYVSYAAAIIEYEGKPALIGTGIDITDRYIMEEKLKRREQQLRIIAENTLDLISQVDENGILLYASPSHLTMLGYKPEKSVGASVFNIIHPDDREKAKKVFEDTIKHNKTNRFEFRLLRVDGKPIWVETLGKAMKSADGKRNILITVSRDITERKKLEERMRFIAEHDMLTNLYNRFYFEQFIEKLEKEKVYPVGLIISDLDGLKLINDTLGHEAGDKLLKLYAEILKKCFPPDSIIARIGGDEFAVILVRKLPHLIDEYIERLRDEICNVNKNNNELLLSVSLGKAARLNSKTSMQDLFKEADKLMYREKLLHSQSNKSSIVALLMKALEARDYITEGHTDRMQHLVRKIGERIGLSESRINDLCLLARFHDIGKVGIPDNILFKPGKLTDEEYEEMKKHCEIGYRIAQSSPDLAHIADFILKHHERWDGTGYPLGLRSNEIPLECRILALVDAYDAMSNDRPYRKAMTKEDIIAELKKCSGKQFDPWLTAIFINILSESGD
ncbi:PAS domain S-box protein [Thermosyntropha sp.]|uniref:PAS domain S-box protein n=1 Tax=Thermosyntropha sp. TaxID=2740820 RepID=UPI0025E330EC|nr:PAS domain S-box protein [Thermosyntropha sp.]MBO8158374.1 PAS domain S-box protein [Thermosyntropha sp.]